MICSVMMSVAVVSNAKAMSNPWIECGDDIGCGAEKAGFNLPLRLKDYTVRAMDGMLEIHFPLDEKREVIVRKTIKAEGEADENGIADISGDYNQYPVNRTVTLKNGVKFAARGEEDNYKVVNFAADTGYYGIMCEDGLRLADIQYLYDLLKEAETPQYGENKTTVKPAYARDCFSEILRKKGVTADCFEHAKKGQDIFCSVSEVKMIKEYYAKGYKNDKSTCAHHRDQPDSR